MHSSTDPTTIALQLHDVVNGAYASKILAYHIIDCRFDYEFNGGHVVGAVNLQSESDIEAHLLPESSANGRAAATTATLPLPSISGLPDASGQAKKTVVIFHCEFSQKRGPELCVAAGSSARLTAELTADGLCFVAMPSLLRAKLLRKKDRAANQRSYPALYYPELYILDGGYCDFFRQQPVRSDHLPSSLT